MLFFVVLNVISARTPTKSRPASQPWLVPAGDPWRTGASGGGTTRETSPPSTRSRCTEPRRSPGRRSAASWPGATRGTRPSCGPCRGRRPKALGARHFVIKSKSFKGTHIKNHRKCYTSLSTRTTAWLLQSSLASCRSPRAQS